MACFSSHLPRKASSCWTSPTRISTHRWSVEYIQHIRDFLKDNDDNNQSSHVLLATHNPIAVAELLKEQVQILMRDTETQKISAVAPDTHPRGMGYAGVITSEMFDLSAALDTYTQDLLEKKRRLSGKDNLSDDETRELRKLTDELDGYGFRYQVRDPELRDKLRDYLENREDIGQHPEQLEARSDEEKAGRLVNQALEEKPGKDRDA